MANKIQLRRGTKAQLATLGALSVAEPGYCTDTKELFIGNASGGNTPLVTATSADITYYVRTDGSDSNTGLANTAAGAFKTITKAINLIPKMVNHKVIINIAAGTYSESVIVSGLVTATDFSIIGSGVVNIVSLEVINCYGTINITGLTATTTTKDSFKASSSGRVVFTSCIASVTSTFSSFWTGSSNVFIDRCTISNRSVGISALAESMVYVGGCTGVNNGIAYLSGYASYLGYQSSVPSGAMVAQDSGMLVPGSGVLNPWGDNTPTNRTGIFAHKGATQSVPVNTWTKIILTQTAYDHLSEFNKTTSTFIAKQKGTYLVNASAFFDSVPVGFSAQLRIFLNGSTNMVVSEAITERVTSLLVKGSVAMYMDVGHTLELYTYITGQATTINLANDVTAFQINRIA